MSSTESQRIQASCEIIWGKGEYDIDIETDDWITYYAVVKEDFGLSFGPPLTMTGLCYSEDHAYAELGRMLGVWATQIQSGQPMTKDRSLEIFGGPNWRNNTILKRCSDVLDERGVGPIGKNATG